MFTSPRKLSLETEADTDDLARKRSTDRLIKADRLGIQGKKTPSEEEEDLADCLIMLSKSADVIEANEPFVSRDFKLSPGVASKGPKFECKACKKVFASHQALGGHRASHKKVKGCYRAKKATNQSDGEEDEDYDQRAITSSDEKGHQPDSHQNRRLKGHECSICHRVFSSGQALGGHKRCHWLTTSSSNAIREDNNFHNNNNNHNNDSSNNNNPNPKPKLDIGDSGQPLGLQLDLNLAAQKLDSTNLMKNTEDHHGQWVDRVDENDDRSGYKVTLRKLSEVMDIHIRPGSSSSWLRLASGD